ncbi:hypothetical protein MOMA_04275 [Moraxella macacae 0408225]|uniref:Uncharacterized protein n=1 Tax=Moraxella macacae 0408225 TaxID=1230338 RepID=L2FA26_9GAMM|nr:hypothetical protein [Moraxella macacae]ELA09591.1 hypothetical protein MOMA_04275 [Moraxella macacae 0408225]
MLSVTDNGVKIALNHTHTTNPFLSLIITTALLLAMVGVALGLGLLSVRASIGALAVIAILSYFWRFYQQKQAIIKISGGQILVSKHQIEHTHPLGKKIYHLQADDKFELMDNQLSVKTAQGKIRLLIVGFSQPQHAKISQAVLQGKTIQTQAKSIKMQG